MASGTDAIPRGVIIHDMGPMSTHVASITRVRGGLQDTSKDKVINSVQSSIASSLGQVPMTPPSLSRARHDPNPFGNIGSPILIFGKVCDPRDEIVTSSQRHAMIANEPTFHATPGHREPELQAPSLDPTSNPTSNPARTAFSQLSARLPPRPNPRVSTLPDTASSSPVHSRERVLPSLPATPPEQDIASLPRPTRPRARDYGNEYALEDFELNAPLKYLPDDHPLRYVSNWSAANPATRRAVAWDLHNIDRVNQGLPRMPAPSSVFPAWRPPAVGDVDETIRYVKELDADKTLERVDWRGQNMNAVRAYYLNMGLEQMLEYWSDAHTDEGDYICVACFTPNLGNEPACTNCKVAKVLSYPLPCSKHMPRLGDGGDWKCLRCKKTNWRKREYCCKCMSWLSDIGPIRSGRAGRRADDRRRGLGASVRPHFGPRSGHSTPPDADSIQHHDGYFGGIQELPSNAYMPYYSVVAEQDNNPPAIPRALPVQQFHVIPRTIPVTIRPPGVNTCGTSTFDPNSMPFVPRCMVSVPQATSSTTAPAHGIIAHH